MAVLRLSYAQLGARLGRSTDAARVRARRSRWQVVRDNKGRAVVLVEESELPPDRPPERSPEPSEPPAGLLARALKAEAEAAAKDQLIAELRAQVAWHRQPWWRRLIGGS